MLNIVYLLTFIIVIATVSGFNHSISYFRNEDFPFKGLPMSGVQEFTVFISDSNICQIRIDFEDFDLASPSVYGECEDQWITINDSISFCGNGNLHQNYLVHIDSVPTTLNIRLNVLSVRHALRHSLKITQIDCTTMKHLAGPRGCTQYFTETSGTIESFNYNGVTMYPQNLDYTICIEKPSDSCGIVYTNPPKQQGKGRSIGLSGVNRGAHNTCQDRDKKGTGDTGCGESCLSSSMFGTKMGDWLSIGMGQLLNYGDMSDPESYKAFYCGVGLGVDTGVGGDQQVVGDGVRDYSGGPFFLHFHTDDNNAETSDTDLASAGNQVNNLGFVIKYKVKYGNC